MKPLFDSAAIEKEFDYKVKYVCTTTLYKSADYHVDVFKRDEPHPLYGGYYFGLYRNPFADNARIMIVNCDKVIENKHVHTTENVV